MRPRILSVAAGAAFWCASAAAQVTNNEDMRVEDRTGSRADCGFTVSSVILPSVRRERALTVRPRRHFRTITAINGLGVTAAQVDTTFNAASDLLQQDSGSGDSSCCTAILRSGAINFVNAPASTPGGVIASSGDLDDIFDLPNDIKIVASIGFCGQSGTYAGCARGNELILTANFAATTVAHEIGHNTGLCHVGTSCNPTCGQAGTCSGCGDGSANNIMYYRICTTPVQDRFTSNQCTTFQGPASR